MNNLINTSKFNYKILMKILFPCLMKPLVFIKEKTIFDDVIVCNLKRVRRKDCRFRFTTIIKIKNIYILSKAVYLKNCKFFFVELLRLFLCNVQDIITPKSS